jgi:replicative DNA helicase
MTELSIIKLFLSKKHYYKYIKYIDKIKLDSHIYKLLRAIDKYYRDYTDHEYIALDELRTYFLLEYPSETGNDMFSDLFTQLESLEVSDSVASDVVHTLLERHYAGKVLEETLLPIIQEEARGSILDIPAIIDDFKELTTGMDAEEESPFVEESLEELSKVLSKEEGLSWRLECLNANLGRMVGSTLGHFFARVEAGKTTLLASEVTHFASQLEDDQEILWVCNEEDGRRIKYRLYQSMLGLSAIDIQTRIKAGQLDELVLQYREAGGDKINVFYDPNVTYEQILELMEKRNVRILVVDIADHVGFRGRSDLSGPQQLGELYRRYRSLAVRFSCDILTVGQASAEAAGKQVLHLEHMHNSRTDKPGALDYAIGLGQSYNASEDELRWINIVKNKIGQTINEISTVMIDKARGLIGDL